MHRVAAALTALVLTVTALAAPSHPPRAEAATGGAILLMPLGDSITWGAASSCGDGYRRDLAGRMTAGGLTVIQVGSVQSGCAGGSHEGHPGYTIAQLTAGVPGWLANPAPVHAGPPDVVLLDAGTNDALAGRTAAQALADMSGLLDAVLAVSPTVRVVVAKLTVASASASTSWAGASVIEQAFNDGLSGVAAAKGPRVRVADMSILPTTSLTEGLHPNDLGYSQMGWVFYRSLAPWYGPGGYLPWTAVPFPAVPALTP